MSLSPRQEKLVEKLTDTVAGGVCGAMLWLIIWYINDEWISARLLLLLTVCGAILGLLLGEAAIRPVRNVIEEWWERW